MNRHYCFPIVTNQEKEMILNGVQSLRKLDSTAFEVIYDEAPQKDFVGIWQKDNSSDLHMKKQIPESFNHKQRQLF
jgi:hypothetical protein